ncbi:MAG TPA: iron-containing alcohol dehydrogenase [Firmicutes bacterium]|nr:iron-containing alcohol dehydrogenase [Bacillota bacterium]
MNAFFKLYCRAYQTVFRLALPVLPYREPRILGELKDLPLFLQQQKISAVLLITDKPLRALDMTRGLENDLSAHGIACAVFDDVVPNPTVQNVEDCRAAYLESGAQAMIAFGGGSVMDCAKAAGARVARPGKPVQKMGGLLKVLRKTPMLIAVPTTAGTGSETTLAAVITDPAAHHKYPINDFVLIPDYAVLDYRVTLGLPPMITATTGMDAMTHAVEAYIGRSTNALTRAMAEEAVVLIVQYLQRAWRDGSDAEARAKMLRAAYCAGIAFTRSYVGYVHGVAHSLGGRYGVPHGLANAVILPYFLEEYGPSCRKKLARLARKAGLAGGNASDSAAAQAMIDWIKQANAAMGIPTSIPEIRKEDIPAMAAYAAKESNPLYPVPKLMDRHELEAMYLKLMPKEV